VVAKRLSKRATCAIAKAPGVIDGAGAGIPRGRLFVVGTGPGTPDWRTPEVERLVGEASDLVGYGLYLDLLGPLADGKTRHDYQLGEERDRVIAALDLAAGGRGVALVSSGDPGIYAMASLVFDCLDGADRADWRRIEITVAPGISALQACAARIGAPLGHDFCAISLSDLLTPWPVIERRLRAAAEGDFVVALYNPASGRRRRQLGRALEILRGHRPPGTPVVVGRSLGRPEETLSVVRLADFDPAAIDMLSIVMIGSSQTRITGGRVYTPRGYRVAGPVVEVGQGSDSR
jgi:cobalt-precorrin 5A hydrolase/precorrin-3B C17-methyltransferase